MAQTTNSDDTDFLSGSTAITLERGVDGETGAEHGGGVFGGYAYWDGEDELLVCADSGGESKL